MSGSEEPPGEALPRVDATRVLAVATALLVVSRVLSRPPDPPMAAMLADAGLRETWPVAGERSRSALEAMGAAIDLEAAGREYERLLADSEVGGELARLARSTIDLAGADGASVRQIAGDQRRDRDEHLDSMIAGVIDDLRERALVEPYIRLPDLVEETLDAHDRLLADLEDDA